jgi:PEP-CTERM motif
MPILNSTFRPIRQSTDWEECGYPSYGVLRLSPKFGLGAARDYRAGSFARRPWLYDVEERDGGAFRLFGVNDVKKNTKIMVAMAALSMSGAPLQAAVVFRSVSTSAATSASVGASSALADADAVTRVFLGLSSRAFSVNSFSGAGGSSSSAQTDVAFAFTDAGHGQFNVSSLTSNNIGAGQSAAASAGRFGFIYNFVLTAPAVLTANWVLNAPNQLQPVSGPTISVSSATSLGLGPNGSGNLAPVNLAAGTYALQFTADYQNLLNDRGPAATNGTSSGQFRFAIEPSAGAVPEPSTWAFMLVGFALLGWALRSRGSRRSILANA